VAAVVLRLRFRYVSKAPLFVIALLPQRPKIEVSLEFQGFNRFAQCVMATVSFLRI
jgi:hypothetical protein